MPIVPKRIRTNPLYDEYMPTIMGTDNLAETNSMLPGKIFYKEGYENNPGTINHEKLHIGQQRVKNPTLESLVKEFYKVVPGLMESPRITEWIKNNWRKQADELPAYLFENDDPSALSKTFATYINQIYKLNPQSSYKLEALAPLNLMKDYITNHPRPMLPPQINMQPMSLLDVWKRRNQ